MDKVIDFLNILILGEMRMIHLLIVLILLAFVPTFLKMLDEALQDFRD